MPIKWIGAALVVSGCGGWGILLAAGYRRQEYLLSKLCHVLRMMQWELRYRLTALPDLCAMAARDSGGELRCVFQELGSEINGNRLPDAASCMSAVLSRHQSLPPKVRRVLRHMGRTLGRFDLDGQLEGMRCVLEECRMELQGLSTDRQLRLRSCQTLALCAGAALVILFI